MIDLCDCLVHTKFERTMINYCNSNELFSIHWDKVQNTRITSNPFDHSFPYSSSLRSDISSMRRPKAISTIHRVFHPLPMRWSLVIKLFSNKKSPSPFTSCVEPLRLWSNSINSCFNRWASKNKFHSLCSVEDETLFVAMISMRNTAKVFHRLQSFLLTPSSSVFQCKHCRV